MQLHGSSPIDATGGNLPQKLPPAVGTTNSQPLTANTGFWGGLSSAVTSLINQAPQLLAVVNQQRLAQENLSRARQGLPPLDVNSIPGLVPTYQVQGGLDAGTQRTVLMLGALAVGAFVLLNVSKPRRARA